MRAEVLKGHLDALLLAAVASGAEHGYAIRERLRADSGVARVRVRGVHGAGHGGPVARDHLTPQELDHTAITVIEAYLNLLARRLSAPARARDQIIAELRDDLVQSTTAQLPTSHHAAAAAHAAISEFGDVDTIAAAFRPELAARYARRFSLILLATGPLVGASWVAAGFGSAPDPAWRWPLLFAVPLVLLGAPAAALAVMATGRLSRWLNPHVSAGPQVAIIGGTIAGTAALLGDTTLLAGTAVVLLGTSAPAPALLALAGTASLARLAFVSTSAASLRRPPS